MQCIVIKLIGLTYRRLIIKLLDKFWNISILNGQELQGNRLMHKHVYEYLSHQV